VVVGRVEEAAGGVGEVDQDRLAELASGDEPALVERRLVEREQALPEIGVVLEDALADSPGVLPRAPKPAIGRSETCEDRFGRTRDWALFVGPDESVQVRLCEDVVKAGLQACTIKPGAKAPGDQSG